MRIPSAGLLISVCLLAFFAGAQPPSVSFTRDVKPILENRCLKCHGPAMQLGKLDLRTREAAMKGSDKGPVIVPGKPEESSFYKKIAGIEKPLMPMDGSVCAGANDSNLVRLVISVVSRSIALSQSA